nr:hypothetical protein [Clostridiales bacterium]
GSAFRGDYFIGDTKYTVTNANPTISIPAHGTIEIRGLTVGTYYRVTSGDFTTSGRVTNNGSTVTITSGS